LLYWQTKVSWSAVLVYAWQVEVRRKKGDHLSDAIATVGMVVSVGAIWVPEIRATIVGAAMATPVAPIAAVVVGVYAIGGIIAFAAADPDDPGWYGAEALKEYHADPWGSTVETAQEHIVRPATSWTERRIEELKMVWRVTAPRMPHYPF